MYLAQLNISNFRKLLNAELHFQRGLNVLVGPTILEKLLCSLKEEVLMLKGDVADRERENRELKEVLRKLEIENKKLRK